MILPPIYLELAIENIGFNTNSALRRKLFNQKAPGDSAAHTGMQAANKSTVGMSAGGNTIFMAREVCRGKCTHGESQ